MARLTRRWPWAGLMRAWRASRPVHADTRSSRSSSGRITAGFGFGYTVAVYFARTQPPSRTVLRAGRLTTPLCLAGLIAAGRGWRWPADALVATGSLISILLLACALRASHQDDRARPAPVTILAALHGAAAPVTA